MSHNGLNCTETFSRLDDYLDRELSRDELQAVEAHLERCAVCAREFGLERQVLETIRKKLKRLAVPPGLMARITAVLDREYPG